MAEVHHDAIVEHTIINEILEQNQSVKAELQRMIETSDLADASVSNFLLLTEASGLHSCQEV